MTGNEELDALHVAAQNCAGAVREFVQSFSELPEPSICADVAHSRARERLGYVHHAIDRLREHIAAWDLESYGPTLETIGLAIDGRGLPFITAGGRQYLTAHEAARELAKAVLDASGCTTCRPGHEAETLRELTQRLRDFGDAPDLEARLQAEYYAATAFLGGLNTPAAPAVDLNSATPAARAHDDGQACKAGYPIPDDYERDKWIYEQRKAGKTNPDIIRELGSRSGWTPLYSEDSIRDAVKRYCLHHGLSVPQGRRGRPTTKNRENQETP
jgi:hypothetical protein